MKNQVSYSNCQINRVAANSHPHTWKKSVDEKVKLSMFLQWLSLTSNWLEQNNPVSVGLSDPYWLDPLLVGSIWLKPCLFLSCKNSRSLLPYNPCLFLLLYLQTSAWWIIQFWLFVIGNKNPTQFPPVFGIFTEGYLWNLLEKKYPDGFTGRKQPDSSIISGIFKEKEPELCVPGKVNWLKGNLRRHDAEHRGWG